MIKYYRCAGSRLEQAERPSGNPKDGPGGIVWIDIASPSPGEEEWPEKLLGISLPTREEMRKIEVSSRLYQEDGAEFMTLTAVIRIGAEEPETTPLTFVLKDNTLVTLRYGEPTAFVNYLARAQKPNSGHCTSGEQIMMGLIEALCDRMADVLEKVGHDIDGVSRHVFRRKSGARPSSNADGLQAIIVKIGRHGDLLNQVRESLVSVSRVLTYHTALEAKSSAEGRDARTRSKVLSRDAQALTDQATFLSGKINFLLDATLGLINLQQNQIIKIFSVAAVVFLPPTLVASIYGMNFQHMPELSWGFGYLWALGLMAASAALPYYFFKRKGWL
jgi:magnesium transporter